MRLIIEFSPTDGLDDGGKLFVQTNPLKLVHIVDTNVSKLSTVEGLFSISSVVRKEMSSLSVASGMPMCVR
jgi:hypothetical protein